MKSSIRVGVLAAAIVTGGLAGCDKPPMRTSDEIPLMTSNIIVSINKVLATTPEGQEIRTVLEQIQAPALCLIETDVATDGYTESKIVCETGPLPGNPSGIQAIIGPLAFPTHLRMNQGLLTIDTVLKDGVLDPYTGCGILNEEITRDGTAMRVFIGSPHPKCAQINTLARKMIESYENIIDHSLSNGKMI